MIQASSNKLIDIISDVIEISQIQTNSINVNKSDFDIIKTIAEVVAEEKIKTIDKHLELTCAMSFPRNQFTISSDKSKVMKIVKHLVDNAIKFTEKGSVRVAAGLHRGNMTLTVTDTGIGISGDMQEKIFEPFRQNASGMCRNYGGNGLGLAIVKAYTDMLGGTISLQSQPNAGTTISVTLPIVDFDDKQLSLDDTPREKSVNSILVVEDEMTNYEFLVELLEERNTSIIHARNGQMAVEICRSGKEIDLILMDIKMPIINGYDAARLIKSFRPDIPIVAQTAYALDIDMKKIEENGFDDFICKPIKENEFFAKIDRFLKP
jgi:CheY-like chemotaxis protein